MRELPRKSLIPTATAFARSAKVCPYFPRLPLLCAYPSTSFAQMTLLLFCFSACFPLPPWTKLVASARLCCPIWLALVQAHIFALPLQRACLTKTSTTSRFDLCHPRTTRPQHNPSPSSNSNARQLDEQQPEWLEAKENPQAESLPEARLAPTEARSSRATLARLVSRLVLHIPQPAPLQP